MWDLFNKRKVRELESKIFDLQRALFESQQFEAIAAEKVKKWVTKHDEVLIKYKELLKNNEAMPQKNYVQSDKCESEEGVDGEGKA